MDGLTRREVVGGVGGVVGVGIGIRRAGAETKATKKAGDGFKILETRVITPGDVGYCGWGTVGLRKLRGGGEELILVYSGGRVAHVCPFGRVEMMKSKDGGKTWSYPRVLLDGPIDDRDAGVLVTSKGTILVTTFSSLAYEKSMKYRLAKGWKGAEMQRWVGVHERLSAKEREGMLGQWMLRSEDGGKTWSQVYGSIVNSPHGPTEVGSGGGGDGGGGGGGGRLLYAGKELWTGKHRIGVCESTDDGKTWKWLAEIPIRKGDRAKDYHELHMIDCGKAGNGRLIVQIRNHNAKNNRETLQSESADGGKTWSEPRSIGVWGLPSHLLRLRDGRLLMSYGHRRKPFGNQARVSEDGGKTWGAPMVISGDGIGGDLGYPSTVELADGTLLTAWYEKMKGRSAAVMRAAWWRLAK